MTANEYPALPSRLQVSVDTLVSVYMAPSKNSPAALLAREPYRLQCSEQFICLSKHSDEQQKTVTSVDEHQDDILVQQRVQQEQHEARLRVQQEQHEMRLRMQNQQQKSFVQQQQQQQTDMMSAMQKQQQQHMVAQMLLLAPPQQPLAPPHR
jgi:hypothetical protein